MFDKLGYSFPMIKAALTVIILVIGCVPVTVFLLLDFNSFILKNIWLDTDRRPSPIYIPQQIVANPKVREADIVIIGGSSMREFFPSESSVLSAELSELCGREIRAFNAATSAQSFADSVAIIDAVKRAGGTPKTIVMGMTIARLGNEEKTWRDVLAVQPLALPGPTSVYAELNPLEAFHGRVADRFAQVRRLAPLLEGGQYRLGTDPAHEESRHFYDRPSMTKKAKQEQALFLSALRKKAYTNVSMTRTARRMSVIFQRYARGGTNIVYFFTPTAPSSHVVMAAYDESIDAATHMLSQSGSVIDVRRNPRLPDEAFVDNYHLRPQGRAMVRQNGVFQDNLRATFCEQS